ncbi:MAG TPA: hypothetical protein VGG29_00975 [Caulobacteraceae bacterium]|jgi:ElaB/YqjD/DUF883 family membrane-anchored ribosome-binding protein
MSSETLRGKAKADLGRLERAAGDVLDDPELQLRGELDQLDGRLEAALGEARERIADAAETMRVALGRAGSRAGAAYETARDRAQAVADTVDPFVHERPYAALALAALAGFVIGALCYGGQRTIYVKPRD